MNSSLIAIYMNPNAEMELGLLERLVHGGGFQLKNGQTGKITLVDAEGDCCATSVSVLAARIRRREDTAFQFWESIWHGEYPGDLYCRVQFKKEAVVIEFGELPRDPDALLQGVWAQCCQQLDGGRIVGMVIDLSGATEDYAEWGALFSGQRVYNGPCPDLLYMPTDHAGLLRSDCETHYRETREGYVTVVAERVGRLLRNADGGPLWRAMHEADGAM